MIRLPPSPWSLSIAVSKHRVPTSHQYTAALHTAADEHQFTRDTVTGPPSGIPTSDNARADLHPHLVDSVNNGFSQSISLTSTFLPSSADYLYDWDWRKSMPTKRQSSPAPVQEEDIWGGNNRPHSLPLSWWRSIGGVSYDWVFSPVSPPRPATRIITRSGVTRCCLLWSLLSDVVRTEYYVDT